MLFYTEVRIMHEQDEQLGLILTQLSYLGEALARELPEPDSHDGEVCAGARGMILSHLIDDWLAGTAGGHTTREENDAFTTSELTWLIGLTKGVEWKANQEFAQRTRDKLIRLQFAKEDWS
jgi:hypothetical protein